MEPGEPADTNPLEPINPMKLLFGLLGGGPAQPPAGGKPKTGAAKINQYTIEQLLFLANSMVTSAMQMAGANGLEASITEKEKDLIVTGLVDLLGSSNPIIANVGKALAPLSLAAGVGLWGARCYMVYREAHPTQPKPKPQPKPANPSPSGGSSPLAGAPIAPAPAPAGPVPPNGFYAVEDIDDWRAQTLIG